MNLLNKLHAFEWQALEWRRKNADIFNEVNATKENRAWSIIHHGNSLRMSTERLYRVP